jgi:phosphatidylglycerophosphate synthase
MGQPGLLNAPNVVSLSRLFLAACFVAIGSSAVRLGLLITALLTDGLDGWLARRSRTISPSGPMVDAIADRIFVLTAVVALILDGMLTPGVALILLSRDIATVIGFVVARIIPWLRAVRFRARLAGKAVTVLQFAILAAALQAQSLVPELTLLTAVASVAAIADYTLALWRGRTRAAV